MSDIHCAICGQVHEGLPDIGSDRPDYYWGVPEAEREARIQLTEDTCVIDQTCFIRGVIEIPLEGTKDTFGFGVWVSQKKENFETYVNDPESDEIGPFFGWLSTRIKYYSDDTINLKTMAHFQGNNQRPRIELELSDHPLARAQHDGITVEEAWNIVHFYVQGTERDEAKEN